MGSKQGFVHPSRTQSESTLVSKAPSSSVGRSGVGKDVRGGQGGRGSHHLVIDKIEFMPL